MALSGFVPLLEARGIDVPGWYKPVLYLLIILGILDIVGAVLIARYKRLGLFIGVGVVAADLILTVVLLITGEISVRGIGRLDVPDVLVSLVSLAALYNVYRYLTHEPEKAAFT
jgi:hypothetical protein